MRTDPPSTKRMGRRGNRALIYGPFSNRGGPCWATWPLFARRSHESTGVWIRDDDPAAVRSHTLTESGRSQSDPSASDVCGRGRCAHANASIPSLLSPPIRGLSTDFGVKLPNKCILSQTATGHNDLCPQAVVGSPRTMVVFGDSHAAMWLPALIPIAKSADWKLIPIIKFACQPGGWISDVSTPSCHPV